MQISVVGELQRYSSGSKHNFCYTDEKISTLLTLVTPICNVILPERFMVFKKYMVVC